MQKLKAQEHDLQDATGICISIVSPRNLLGAEFKEASRIVTSHADPLASIAVCIEYSDTLAADAIEVDVFAFGRV